MNSQLRPAKRRYTAEVRDKTRLLSNGEVIERGREKYGSISLRVSFTVRDADGQYKALRRRTVTVKKIADAEGVERVIERMTEAI